MAKKKQGVDRSIYYYDVSVENIDNNTNTLVNVAKPSEILVNAFQKIKKINDKLGKAKAKDRRDILRKIEYSTEYGDKIYIDVESIDKESGRIRFKIILCRLDALPYIEQDGKLTNLTTVVNGEFNIAEVTHCILFTKEMVMGAEFNFNGARPSAISFYLPTITGMMDRITCSGKMRKDVFERITEEEGFSLFEICVNNTPKMRTVLRDNMGLLGSFFNTIENVDTYEVSIRRRVGKKKEGFLPPVAVRELENIVEQNREDIKLFKVSQAAYKDAIDLLSDKLVKKQEFILTENKTIDSAEMFGAINNFFDATVVNL